MKTNSQVDMNSASLLAMQEQELDVVLFFFISFGVLRILFFNLFFGLLIFGECRATSLAWAKQAGSQLVTVGSGLVRTSKPGQTEVLSLQAYLGSAGQKFFEYTISSSGPALGRLGFRADGADRPPFKARLGRPEIFILAGPGSPNFHVQVNGMTKDHILM